MAMIDKKDYSLFAQCASIAFGREMSIMIAPEGKEASLNTAEAISGTVDEPAHEEKHNENLEDALNILQQLSQEEGFNILED